MGLRITGKKPEINSINLSSEGELRVAGQTDFAPERNRFQFERQLLTRTKKIIGDLFLIIIHMENLVAACKNASLSDKERKFLFIEYQACYNEVARITLRLENLCNNNDNFPDRNLHINVKIMAFQCLKDADYLLKDSGISLDEVQEFLSGGPMSGVADFFIDVRKSLLKIEDCLSAEIDLFSHKLTIADIAQENLRAMSVKKHEVEFAAEHLLLAKADSFISELLDKNFLGVKFRI